MNRGDYMKKRLISCDLDETLLTTNKKIPLFTRLYIRHFCKKGNVFVINTGRAYQSAMRFYNALKLKDMLHLVGNDVHNTYLIRKDKGLSDKILGYIGEDRFEEFFRIFSNFSQKGLAIEQMFCYTKSTEKQEKSTPRVRFNGQTVC